MSGGREARCCEGAIFLARQQRNSPRASISFLALTFSQLRLHYAGGVYSNQYFLGGKDESLVNPGEGSLQLGNGGILAEYANGTVTAVFDLTLPGVQYPDTDVIFASGPPGDGTTGRIPAHTAYYRGRINWETGAEGEREGSGLTKVRWVGAVLLLPSEIVCTRLLCPRFVCVFLRYAMTVAPRGDAALKL